MELVENGNVDAIYELAIRNYYGYGIEKNYAEAFKIFKELSDGGDMDARYYLARMYYFSEGVTKNNEIAFKLFNDVYNNNQDKDAKYFI